MPDGITWPVVLASQVVATTASDEVVADVPAVFVGGGGHEYHRV